MPEVRGRPPKTITPEERQRILAILAETPQGAPTQALITALGLERRTAQRRLNALVASGDLIRTGEKRGVRYRLAKGAKPQPPDQQSDAQKKPSPPPPPAGEEPIDIALSPAAREIIALVERPVGRRDPVGYRRGFVEGYRPNTDHYLPETTRAHLLEIGRGGASESAPAGTYARNILNRLLIDLAWNSSRLEGNTYSLLDTERLITEGQVAEGKSALEATMILNHKAAIEFLVEDALEIGFNPFTVQNLHAALAADLLPDPMAPGRLRRAAVQIGESVFHPLETPQLIEEMFRIVLAKADAIDDPYEQAFFAMVHLPYLQPFDDVNKRVSRLAANIPMIRRNLTPISFKDVPQDLYVRGVLGVYELNRVEALADVFIWAVERSAKTYAAIRQSIGEPDPFRVKHRGAIHALVQEAVRNALSKQAASRVIAAWTSEHIPKPDRVRFIEAVESELLGLSETNFARYRLRPAEFRAWKAAWGS
jgi:hypothetical protein